MFSDLYKKYINQKTALKNIIIGEIQDDYDLSDEECCELLDEYGNEIQSINAVYEDYSTAAIETAYSLGLVSKENEEYFNFEKLEEDLFVNDNFIQLKSGKVVYITQ